MPEPSFRLTAPVFRAHNPFWFRDPASGEGAGRHGGRFDRRGVPALYTATTPLGAILEASPGGRPLQPITLCEYRVDCADVVDATDPEVRGALEIEDDDLACPDWRATMLAGGIPRSQALADRLVALGFAGLRVPSFAPRALADGVNVVFWRWEPELPHLVRVAADDNRLPPGPLERH
ncbi:MAG: RES domain-containing protein [Alphaproteobacteria bacterium]|nr:RES domain-containing protein [Alphaproteobacteria bacterium]